MNNEYTAGQAVRFTHEDQWEGQRAWPGTEATYIRPSASAPEEIAYLRVDGREFLTWTDFFEPVVASDSDGGLGMGGHKFEVGDKASVRPGAASIGRHHRDPAEVRDVVRIWDDGRVALRSTFGNGNVFRPEDLIWHPDHDPSKVKPGDTVTVLIAPAGHAPTFTVTGEAYVMGPDDALWVGPYPIEDARHALTDHQPAPEPEPEWKDGQIGDALVHGASVRGFISNSGESFVFSVPGGGYHEAGHGSFEDFVPLVVIDRQTVDLDKFAHVIDGKRNAGMYEQASAALKFLGIIP